MPWVLYRVVRTRRPRRSDFWSDLANGLPPRPAQRAEVAAYAGVSLYDTAEAAELTARSYPWMGTFIARLEISDNAPIVARQTLKSGHFSVVGDPAELLARVAQVLPIP